MGLSQGALPQIGGKMGCWKGRRGCVVGKDSSLPFALTSELYYLNSDQYLNCEF